MRPLEAVTAQLRTCEAVCPGSDLHMYLTVKLLSLQQQHHGPASPQAVAAGEACARVLRVRYGPVEDGVLEVLLRGAVYGLSRVAV